MRVDDVLTPIFLYPTKLSVVATRESMFYERLKSRPLNRKFDWRDSNFMAKYQFDIIDVNYLGYFQKYTADLRFGNVT